MRTKALNEALLRVEHWPPEAQDELAEMAVELDAGVNGGEYRPTPAELAGIDRGLRAASDKRFVSEEQVDATLAKFRRR